MKTNKTIFVVMFRNDPSEEWMPDVAFKTEAKAKAQVKWEMKLSGIPKKEWDKLCSYEEIELR